MKKTAFLFVILIALTSLPVLGGVKVNNPVEQAKIYLVEEDYDAAVPLLQEAAEQGDPDAQSYLGYCYYYGTGVEQDFEKAAEYYQLAADQGEPYAQFSLGCCYFSGSGVMQDYEKAVEYFKLAADQGLPDAQYNLAQRYELGEGVEQDYKKATEYYQLAADQGIAEALTYIGWMYYKGEGVGQDYELAVKYFREAADQGEIYATFNLGMCYQDGTGVEKDIEKAAELYQIALDGGYEPVEEEKARVEEVLGEENGTAEETTSITDQAQALLDAEDYEAAILLLQEAADQGDPVAQNKLGNCYSNGWGVEQDYEEALKWYHLAADQGYENSMTNIGQFYAHGMGVDQDYEEAINYYQRAAEKGEPIAQYLLGVSYQYGFGVEQDYEEAVKYYKLAADQGNAAAQYNLGICYEEGKGVPQDDKEAVRYYKLAADQGNAEAQNSLGYRYSEGLGVERNDEEAVKYFQLAADQGNADGIYNLGYSFYFGEGVEQDYEKAWDLFQQSAGMDQPNAIFMIGECYYLGNGVEKDLEKAAEWYEKALDAGYKPDEEDKARLKEVLGEEYGTTEETTSDDSDSSPDKVDIKDRKLTEEELAIAKHVIANFLKMEAVPRPSGHEEKISAFFMDWAKEQGFDPIQDEVLNVVFDVPAMEGYEDYPMVGLQAHMDMVCVGESEEYDPENDPIKVIVDYDAATMTADGTSLGADDGIGCAIIMSMAQGLAPHGPLRVILTVNEEDTMAGIMNLDPAAVADLSYLINVDSEVSNAVTVSTAGGVQIDVTKDKIDTKAPDGGCAVEISVNGLMGGHSGMDINKGRLNAIYALETVLKELAARNIPYEMASFVGGTASNAIPAEAKAMTTIKSEDQEKVFQTVADVETKLKEAYKNTEHDLAVRAGVVNEIVKSVVSSKEVQGLFSFMDGIVNGVYSMSDEIDGLVESSSNLGVISLTPELLAASMYERSSNAEKTDEILEIDQEVIDENGLDCAMEPSGDPWPYNPDSVLLPLTQKVYLEQNGEDIAVETLHATLECGTFAVMNPSLDMVSIGPDLIDVHSTGEMIYLRTIPKTFNLLAGILDGIADAEK